jgi:hypothetical protein
MRTFTRNSAIVKAQVSNGKRVMISVPLTGMVRAEWMMARYTQGIPTNWSQVDIIQWIDQYSPLGFLVADARNVAVKHFVEQKFEWLFFIDHDVVMPMDTFSRWNQRMLKGDVPIWGGLYFTKSVPAEPLLYRELGSSYFIDWKMGEEVWVGSMGLGCNVIHRSILELIYKESPEYQVGDQKVRQVFKSPMKSFQDAETLQWRTEGGTEDIYFYNRLREEKIFARSGWKSFQQRKWPILCDTNVFCRHIDWAGNQYPMRGEEKQFEK